jgi:hypothetical protein
MCSITPNAEDANGPRRVLGEEAIVEAVDEEINLLQAYARRPLSSHRDSSVRAQYWRARYGVTN